MSDFYESSYLYHIPFSAVKSLHVLCNSTACVKRLVISSCCVIESSDRLVSSSCRLISLRLASAKEKEKRRLVWLRD